MNWKTLIFKPRWEHKSPEVRAEAVSESQDQRLLERLPELAAKDESPLVRRAAVARLTKLDNLKRCLDQESDARTKAAIHSRIRQLLSDETDSGLAVSTRVAFIEHWSDPELMQALATRAAASEVRLAALKHISQQGFLGDRAVEDTDAEIRRYAVDRVDQLSTLERVAKGLRTKDKRLYRRVLERLERERVQAGDTDAINAAAVRLCVRLEQLARGDDIGRRREQLAELEKQWQPLADKADASVCRRYQGARDILQAALDRPNEKPDPQYRARQQVDALFTRFEQLLNITDFDRCQERLPELEEQWQGLQPAIATADEAPRWRERYTACRERASAHLLRLSRELEVNPTLSDAWQAIHQYQSQCRERPARKRVNQLLRLWQDAWAPVARPNPQEQSLNNRATAALAELQQRAEQIETTKEDALNQAVGLLDRLEQLLDNGDLGEARGARHDLQEMLGGFSADKRWKQAGHHSRLLQLQGRLRELRDWQHWSNNKIRKRLITEAEHLTEQGMHPDAVIARLKALQKEWRELEESEQLPGEKRFAASPRIWRKFNAACHHAFETTKPFLDKRSEVQLRRQKEMADLCRRMQAAAEAEPKDWPAITQLLKTARQEIRCLDEVPAKRRKATARQLRDAMDIANAVMNEHYREIEKVKLKLIRQAEQLRYIDDRDEAIEKAKQLQRDWKNAGRLWRSKDNKLWRAFREPIDPLFEQLDKTFKAQKAARQEQRQQLEQLCADAEALAALNAEALTDASGRLSGLQAQWEQQQHREPGLDKRFRHAVNRFESRLEAFRQERVDARRTRWRDKLALCLKLESMLPDSDDADALIERLAADWPAAAEHAIDKMLQQRWETVQRSWQEHQSLGEVDADAGQNTDTARQLCIQAEFLAGLESPKAEREARMRYQVERQSKTLSDSSQRLPAIDEARQLEHDWYRLGYLAPAQAGRLVKRFNTAIDEVIRHNQ